VELGGVRQVTRVERHLHVLDVVNILLRICLQLLDVDLLRGDDAVDFVGEAFPTGVLVAHNTLDDIGKRRLVLVVLEHAQTPQRRQLETVGLLVGVVHEVTDIQNKTQDTDQT
jgi:hypothetical protein